MSSFKSGYVQGGVCGFLGSKNPPSKDEQDEGLSKLFSSPPKAKRKKKKKTLTPGNTKIAQETVEANVENERKNVDKKIKKKKRKSDSDTLLAREAIFATESSPPKKKKKKKPEISSSKELSPPDPTKEARTVFVGNLSVEMEKKNLKRLFRGFGEIESIRFRSAAAAELKIPKKVAVIKKEFHPKKSNINAYIVFKEEESAVKSLKMNSRAVDGMHIHVDLAGKEKKHDHSRSIFVGNLPFDIQEEAVREHFEDCGSIENVRIIRDKKTGLGKGFGYILFNEKDAVTLALRMASSEEKFQGRQLRISRSAENPQKVQVTNKKSKKQLDHTPSSDNKKKKPRKDEIQGKNLHSQKERNPGKSGNENIYHGSTVHKSTKKVPKQKHMKRKLEMERKKSLGSYLIGSKNVQDKNSKLVITDKKTLSKHQRKKMKRNEESNNPNSVKRKAGNQIFARNRMSKRMKK